MCSNNGFKHERDFFFKYHKINFVWALLFNFASTHSTHILNPYRRRCLRRWLWMTTLLWKGYSFGINVKYIYIFLPSLDSDSSHATSHNAFTPFLLHSISIFFATCNLIDSLALFLLHLFCLILFIVHDWDRWRMGEEFQFFFVFIRIERNHFH